MQYLKYSSKVMNITQNYNNSFSHKPYSSGKPASYPIDEACEDSGKSYLYAPCDVVVKRIYGVGTKGANTIWLQSVDKVKLANGTTSFVTILVQHPNDDTLKKLKVGQVIKQGKEVCLEGTDGNVTGNHFHIEVASCEYSKLKNKGWVQNSKGMWVISNNAIKPENAFYIDKSFTKIKNSNGLSFKELPKEEPKSSKEQLILPKSAKTWNIYPLNKKPVKGNEIAKLLPSKFGGLTYDILDYSMKDVAIIETRDYGKVQIYVAPSTGAIIKK